VKPPPFAYARAESRDEAVAFLAEWGDDAKVLAGGQSLMPLMNFRLARPAYLVDINGVDELADFRAADGDGLVIGALCRHAFLEGRDELEGPWRALAEAMPLIGHYPIRVRGTAGGSIAHADPAAELPVVCAALGAELVAASTAGARTIPAAEFFAGPFTTALRPDELLVEVRVPGPPTGAVTAFEEFSERAGDFALACVCAGAALSDGRCTWARIALGGVGPAPVRATEAEEMLVGSDLGDDALTEAAHAAAAGCNPGGDFHASAMFRKELVVALLRRAFQRVRAADRAQ
jgi:carbon-monoxide dehydrogenase medium subunit/6-hydroxypseudooxynicotine dehydrogenase subunit alpha